VTDRREIERVYRAYGHLVLRRARVLLGSEAEARDACHEIFLDLLAHPEQLKGVTQKTAWLYRVTTNYCFKHLRSRTGRGRLLTAVTNRSPAISPIPSGELVAWVRELLERLPPQLAEVAVYYHVDELTHDEISQILGCSRRHVGDLLVQLKAWSVADVATSST
jgi:RNA polymerase sigma factor (sigma-70 family)